MINTMLPAKISSVNASVLARAAGVDIDDSVDLVFGETDENHPFVSVQQMMPFVPFVRPKTSTMRLRWLRNMNMGSAIQRSFTREMLNMTKLRRQLDATLYVKNGPSMSALGLGGKCHLSFSIAGPTGEGVTTANTFTRERRCSMIDELRVV